MSNKTISLPRLLAIAALFGLAGQVLHSHGAELSAMRLAQAQQAPLVAVTQVGAGLVAVGDHGVVVHSVDGQHWHQAKVVPVDGLLTALSFADGQNGWAVGHGGVLLRTKDGGETWTLQPPLEGKPVLLSVWFENSQHGIVVGAYGFASETRDGGRSWQRLSVSNDGDDYHLNQIFAGRNGHLFIAGEGGNAYRSPDNGTTWETLDTGVNGSLWGGASLRDGRVLLVGMSGRVLVSDDLGDTWQTRDSGSQEAITAVVQLNDGRVALVGNGGLVAVADQGLQRFKAQVRADRQNLAALAPLGDGQLALFGPQGVLTQDLTDTH